jgi:hypothetical protein
LKKTKTFKKGMSFYYKTNVWRKVTIDKYTYNKSKSILQIITPEGGILTIEKDTTVGIKIEYYSTVNKDLMPILFPKKHTLINTAEITKDLLFFGNIIALDPAENDALFKMSIQIDSAVLTKF